MANRYFSGGQSSNSPFNDPAYWSTTVPIVRTASRSGTTITIPSGTSGLSAGMSVVNYLSGTWSVLGNIVSVLSGTTVSVAVSGTITSRLFCFGTRGSSFSSSDNLVVQNLWGVAFSIFWSSSASFGRDIPCADLLNESPYQIGISSTLTDAIVRVYGRIYCTGGGSWAWGTAGSYPNLYLQAGSTLDTAFSYMGVSIFIESGSGTATINNGFTWDATRTFNHNSGTLQLNGNIGNCNAYLSSPSGAGARITNGTGNITVTTASSPISAADLSSYTWNSTGYIRMPTRTTTSTIALGNTSAPTKGPNIDLVTTGGSGSINWTGSVVYANYFKLNYTTSFGIVGTTFNVGSFDFTGSMNQTCFVNFIYSGDWVTNQGSYLCGGFTINHSGTTRLVNSLTLNSTAPVTPLNFTSGTLDLNGYTLTASTYNISGGSAKTINGPGTLDTTTTTSFNLSSGSTITRGATNYTINLRQTSAKTFAGGGGQYGTITQAGSGALTITGSNSLNDVTTSVLPTTINFEAGSTQTLTNFTLSGTSGSLATIQSNSTGTQFNLSRTVGTVSVNYLSIKDSNVAAAFFCNNTSVNVSNNTGWNFTTPAVIQAGFSGF
jgi:fibronectin-binding autotransporter adhesin